MRHPTKAIVVLALALLSVCIAAPAAGATPPARATGHSTAAAGYNPYFRSSWTFLNGTRAQRAQVRREIRRMRFPHKAFLGRFVAIRFVSRFAADQGWAAARDGYVEISLFPGWNAFVVAHEIGHAADYTMLRAKAGAFGRLVGRHAPAGDCLRAGVKWKRRFAALHSCRWQEEWASGFARAYCCGEPRVGIEGRRVPRKLFRAFAQRNLHPQDSNITRLIKRPCYFPAALFLDTLPPTQCRARGGVINPTLVNCTYSTSSGHAVTQRLELNDCKSRIAASSR